MEQKSKKIFYSMGEVTEMFDVNPSLIRFWEKQFPILKPHKNKKGNRMFTAADVENLRLIYHLVKEKGMTLAGAGKALRKGGDETTREAELTERLLKIRSMLEEIRQELAEPGENAIVIEHHEEPARVVEFAVEDVQTASGQQTVSEPEIIPEAGTEPELEAVPAQEAIHEALPLAEPETESEMEPQADPESEPEQEPLADPESEPEQESEPEHQPEPEPAPQPLPYFQQSLF